jgi:hypothetical protein
MASVNFQSNEWFFISYIVLLFHSLRLNLTRIHFFYYLAIKVTHAEWHFKRPFEFINYYFQTWVTW